jgi:ADP-ribose pyrophosphatase YjhB (NUDIX family)
MLFTNAVGDILLLETTYKVGWEIPGGHADAGESPRTAAKREAREELGLEIEPGPLLVLQHEAAPSPRGDMLAFVFEGGVVTDPSTLRPDNVEIAAVHFVPLPQVHQHTSATMHARLQAAMRARQQGHPIEIGSDLA